MDINEVHDLIEIARSENRKAIPVFCVLPPAIVKQLEAEGYNVYPFGKHTVVDWQFPRESTNRKISIPLVLEFISQLAAKATRNILTWIP